MPDEAGVKLFIVKQNRFNVPVVKARDAGRFGKLILARCACAGAATRPITTRTPGAAIPHFWSILNLLLDGEEPRLRAVRPQSLGAAEVELDVGAARARLVFGRTGRGAPAPCEREPAGWLGFAELDFAIEPGRLTIDGVDHPLMRPAGVGPLAMQVRDFLDLVARPRNEIVCRRNLRSVVSDWSS